MYAARAGPGPAARGRAHMTTLSLLNHVNQKTLESICNIQVVMQNQWKQHENKFARRQLVGPHFGQQPRFRIKKEPP